MTRGRIRSALTACALALALGAAGCGPSAEEIARERAQALQAQRQAEQAQAAAEQARVAALKAQAAADQAQKAVDDATREINRVAAHLKQMERDRAAADGASR